MRAFVYSYDGDRTEIEAASALTTSLHRPVVLQHALQELGLLAQCRELYFDAVEAVASAEAADELRRRGLERLHDLLDADQVAALVAGAGPPAAALALPLCRGVVEVSTEPPRPHYFVCARTFVRAMVPYRVAERSAAVMDAGHLYGHVRPAEPHRDFWLSHARDAISVWSAIGPVRAGNSLELYEGSDHEPGRHVSPALDAGDVLLFNSDSLHASVRNELDETRVALGHRIALGRRLRFGPGTHWRPWYDAALVDTPLRAFATLQSRLSLAAWRRWRWRRAYEREQRALAHSQS